MLTHYARATNNKKAAARAAAICAGIYREEANVLGRPGSDLLFQVLRLSTIGAGKFNGRVRDGIGYRLPANTTRPAKDAQEVDDRDAGVGNAEPRYDFQASWSIINRSSGRSDPRLATARA